MQSANHTQLHSTKAENEDAFERAFQGPLTSMIVCGAVKYAHKSHLIPSLCAPVAWAQNWPASRRAWSIPPTTAAADDEMSSYTQLNAIKLKGRKQKPARDQSAALPPPPRYV